MAHCSFVVARLAHKSEFFVQTGAVGVTFVGVVAVVVGSA
jgi:hypothetical protein